MKSYVCKSCGYSWQSANPALECARFGCGSRLVSEVSQSYGGSATSRVDAYRGGASFIINNSSVGVAPASATTICVLAGVSLVFFVPALLVALAGIGGNNDDLFSVGVALFVFGGVPFLIGVIMLLSQMHRAWQTVQPAAGLGRGLKIPSPGKAIGYLFIPLFNFYWVFIAFKGLMDVANALKEDRHIPGPPFCSGVATSGAVVFVVAFSISPLFLLMLLIACCLIFPIARDVVRIINTLR